MMRGPDARGRRRSTPHRTPDADAHERAGAVCATSDRAARGSFGGVAEPGRAISVRPATTRQQRARRRSYSLPAERGGEAVAKLCRNGGADESHYSRLQQIVQMNDAERLPATR